MISVNTLRTNPYRNYYEVSPLGNGIHCTQRCLCDSFTHDPESGYRVGSPPPEIRIRGSDPDSRPHLNRRRHLAVLRPTLQTPTFPPSKMRASLQRSCNACARSKHACDLQTPRCSRCIKRKTSCVYANEPLTSRGESSGPSGRRDGGYLGERSVTERDGKRRRVSPECSIGLVNALDASFDPFDSYPPTRLPRAHVQRLIHHCTHILPNY